MLSDNSWISASWPWEASVYGLGKRAQRAYPQQQVARCSRSVQRNSSAHSFLLPSGGEMIPWARGMLLLAPPESAFSNLPYATAAVHPDTHALWHQAKQWNWGWGGISLQIKVKMLLPLQEHVLGTGMCVCTVLDSATNALLILRSTRALKRHRMQHTVCIHILPEKNKTWDSNSKAWVCKVHGLCLSTLREQEEEELGERENKI